jgi:hypothetical protein
MDFDRHVLQSGQIVQPRVICLGRQRPVGHHAQHRRPGGRAHLPHVQIGHVRIAVGLDCPAHCVAKA